MKTHLDRVRTAALPFCPPEEAEGLERLALAALAAAPGLPEPSRVMGAFLAWDGTADRVGACRPYGVDGPYVWRRYSLQPHSGECRGRLGVQRVGRPVPRAAARWLREVARQAEAAGMLTRRQEH